jgi:hypothetical protein
VNIIFSGFLRLLRLSRVDDYSQRQDNTKDLQSGAHPRRSASPRRNYVLEECALYAQLLKAVKNKKGISSLNLVSFVIVVCLSVVAGLEVR